MSKDQILSHNKCLAKRIGVWIETPGSAFNIGEGIARVICKVIPIWVTAGSQVTIVCSNECSEAIKKVILDLGGAEKLRLNFITVKETTKLQKMLLNFQGSLANKLKNLKKSIKSVAEPFYVFLKFLIHRYRGNRAYPMPNLTNLPICAVKGAWYTVKAGFLFVISLLIGKLLKSFLCRYDYKADMGRKASKVKVDTWFVPRPDWFLAANLGPNIIWCFWDLIPIEAPIFFPVDLAIEGLSKTVQKSGQLITMSNYVRNEHCIKTLQIHESRVRCMQPPFHRDIKPRSFDENVAIIKSYMKKTFSNFDDSSTVNPRYLIDFPFWKTDFIFLPTQIREYKNFFNVVLAIEKLIRRYRIDIKLVTTGDLTAPGAADALKYLRDRGLVFDIVSIPKLPTEVLYSFMSMAKISLCPAFCEGGLPLAFMESVARGTPVVIAKMPNVKEVFDWESCDNLNFAFNPSNVNQLVRALVYTLENPSEVLKIQQTILDNKFNYSWGEYANFIINDSLTKV